MRQWIIVHSIFFQFGIFFSCVNIAQNKTSYKTSHNTSSSSPYSWRYLMNKNFSADFSISSILLPVLTSTFLISCCSHFLFFSHYLSSSSFNALSSSLHLFIHFCILLFLMYICTYNHTCRWIQEIHPVETDSSWSGTGQKSCSSHRKRLHCWRLVSTTVHKWFYSFFISFSVSLFM